jgi:methyltransferase-like protein/cyclopropane fatty-acyl-phospholipid synthase-like methyltransferase
MPATPAPPATASSYDVIPYESYAYKASHPDTLATVATLLGMRPAPPDRCRVLELGCASGGNLMPMALAMPGSSFLGIDLSARQVGYGQTALEAVGLKNVELRQASITDVDEGYGRFDYVLAHGVYSWVPDEVQDKLLAICKANLAPDGVAYVSYNTYPGWHMQEMLRDMMVYHSRRFADPGVRVKQARALLDFLAQAVPQQENPYGILLRQSAARLGQAGDYYLAHDHLEAINAPVYFHQFIARAEAKGLQYLGESEMASMGTFNFAPEVQQKLRQLSSSDLEIEQFMDFVRNRTFRQTLLCHQGIKRTPQLKPETVAQLRVASRARPVEAAGAVSPETAQFATETRTITTADPLVKAALFHLCESWPLYVPFEELRQAARARAGLAPAADAAEVARDTDVLGRPLLQCYLSSDTVQLHTYQPPVVAHVSERPVASPVARYEAQFRDKVTNLHHDVVTMDEFGRRLLPLLNGGRTHAAVVEGLVELARAGALTVHADGKKVTDEADVRRSFAAVLTNVLPKLARLALLVG